MLLNELLYSFVQWYVDDVGEVDISRKVLSNITHLEEIVGCIVMTINYSVMYNRRVVCCTMIKLRRLERKEKPT